MEPSYSLNNTCFSQRLFLLNCWVNDKPHLYSAFQWMVPYKCTDQLTDPFVGFSVGLLRLCSLILICHVTFILLTLSTQLLALKTCTTWLFINLTFYTPLWPINIICAQCVHNNARPCLISVDCTDLDNDFALEGLGWGQGLPVRVTWLWVQGVPKYCLHVEGHGLLLLDTTVVLNRQHHWVPRHIRYVVDMKTPIL